MTEASVNRRGACPALSAPMQTGDGLLVRLNPLSQALTPKQLVGLGNSAMRHGNGIMEVTARGSLQIRGLTENSAALLADDVNALGISPRTGVPIDISPLAGLDPREIADPRPLAAAIGNAIDQAGLANQLGPKVSVVIDGGGQIDMTQISADVRLTAARRRNGAFWRIAIAGDAQAAEPMGGSTASGTVVFALDLLGEIAALGIEGRARDLITQRSAATTAHPLASPQHRQAIALLDGRIALSVALPYGSAVASDLIALAEAADVAGVEDIRLAPARRLLLLCPDTDKAVQLFGAAARLGFIMTPDDPRLSVSACAGAPACASGRIATREIAERLVAETSDAIARLGDIHISGCEKGCAHPADAALTLVGKVDGVGIVVDGKARDAARTVVPAADLPEAVNAIDPTGP